MSSKENVVEDVVRSVGSYGYYKNSSFCSDRNGEPLQALCNQRALSVLCFKEVSVATGLRIRAE